MGHKNNHIFSRLYIWSFLWPIGTRAHYCQIIWQNSNGHESNHKPKGRLVYQKYLWLLKEYKQEAFKRLPVP